MIEPPGEGLPAVRPVSRETGAGSRAGSETSLPRQWEAAARAAFGARLDLAARYATLLSTVGVQRGLVGPREHERVWDRHLLNSAALVELLPDPDETSVSAPTVADLGSGAGLPGLVLALARPDFAYTLVEPMQRRVDFLVECVADLGLHHVEVVRARAEELHGRRRFDVVVSRALAPLPRLLRWSLPLVTPGGTVLALKGKSAAEELSASAEVLSGWSIAEQRVRRIEPSYGGPGATVVAISLDPSPMQTGSASRPGRPGTGGRRRAGGRRQ